MQLKEEAIFTLKFDGKPVINELGELEQRLNEVKEAQKSVERGTKEWAENKVEIKELEASIKQVREEMGVSGMTVRQLEGYYKQLNREIKDLTPGTEAYAKKAADLGEVNQALTTHRQTIRGVGEEANQTQGIWSNVKSWITNAFTITAVIEAGRMLVGFFTDSVKEFRAFQSAAQDLSAVTGATGKDLDYLKAQAKEVGPTFGKSGAEMLEAYKLMASAKPELLAQKELLAETTKAALTLADAGKIDLATATKVTAESLNQFGESANQANRFINVIAAGAKEGSAEIDEMGMSLKASGTVAKSAGLSFEQTNATLQSMSTIALKGEQAGTMLRNVLVKLQTGADETNPKIVGMEKALDNLAKQNLSTAEMAKMFGTENLVAAQHIVEHRKEIGELTTKLTGTDEAFKQAATNNATLDHEIAKTTATIKGIGVEIGEKLSPIIIKIVGGFNDLVSSFGGASKGAGPLITVIGMIFDIAGQVATQIWNLTKVIFGIKDGAEGAGQILKVFTGILAIVGAGVGGVVGVIGMLVDGLRILRGQGTFEELKKNASANLDTIKNGLKAAFIDEPKKITSEAAQVAGNLEKAQGTAKLKANQEHLTARTTQETTAAQTIGGHISAEDQKTLDKKAAQAEKHRQTELKKAQDAAKKEAEETVKANNEALKKTEDLRIEGIKNDLDRTKAAIRSKRDSEVEAMMASKASTEVKAVWEQARNEQMIRDIAKAEDDHRKKKEKEEAEADKRTLDLKIKLSGDEKADKLQKLEDLAAAQRAQVQKDVTSETQKAQLLKQINDTLIRDKEKVEQEYRQKKQQEETALQNALYQATVADANNRLALAGSNAQAIYNAKKAMLDAEYSHNQQKLQREAAEEKAKNQELIQDADRRAQADKAIDDRLKSQLKANDIQYETDKTALTVEKTAARKKNQEEFFSAVKGLMTGDFTTFSDLLTKKLSGEKTQLTAAQKANVDKIDTVGGYAVMAVNALSALNAAALNKELGNINKEKTTQLAAWKDKYDKGIINKDQYEKGVDRINKEAAEKEKQARLDSFKRQQKLDIAMAIINGIQAALKSLAMFGWPLGLIGAAGAAVAAGIQIAAIRNQQPPSMRRGGMVNAGVPEGPRHGSRYGESGLSITRRDTGEEVAEMEGGEPVMVLSRNTYSNNRKVVDSLMHSSLHRNGAPIMQQGGIMFDDGGTYDYENAQSSKYNGSSGGSTTEPLGVDKPADSSPGGDWMNQAGAAADEMDASSYQAEIDKSQETMENIAKNTLATVDNLKLLMEAFGLMQKQLDASATAQQTFLETQVTGLRTDLASGLETLSVDNALGLVNLKTQLHDDLVELQGAFKLELPTLGDDLKAELVNLQNVVSIGLYNLRSGINEDLYGLKQTTQLGLDALQKGIHEDVNSLEKQLHFDLTDSQTLSHRDALSLETLLQLYLSDMQRVAHLDAVELQLLLSDLQKGNHVDAVDLQKLIHTDLMDLRKGDHQDWLDLQKLIHTDLGDFQKAAHQDALDGQKLLDRTMADLQLSVHDDLSDLNSSVHLSLTDLQKAVHLDLENLKLAQAIQQALLLKETNRNFTDLQTLLKTELENLRRSTHTDLGLLQEMTQYELQAVQRILNLTKNGQGYQSTLLRIISEKNLTVSVQNVLNIQNQIDVVVDKSNFK